MRRYWLLFAQTVTIALGIYVVIAALRPEWVGRLPPQGGLGPGRSVPVLQAPASLRAPGSYRDAAGRAMPAVVNYLTSKALHETPPPLKDPFFKRFFGDKLPPQEQMASLGSGVIVSADGYILTNYHVVEGADEIEVGLADGRKAAADIVGTDPETDLAVIRIKTKNLPVIVLGDMEQARVGDMVLAVGNPFGVGQTVTLGIISALSRGGFGINGYEDFIQTDAAINPGNSGGAMIDVEGRLVGINTAILSRSGGFQGVGFAVPGNLARMVMERLVNYGKVTRGYLGVSLQPEMTSELVQDFNLPDASG